MAAWYEDKDYVTQNPDGTFSQSFNRDGETVTWTQDANGMLLNETRVPGTTPGLRESNTESNRTTTYTFNDGQTYTGTETNWEDAARAAGNTSGLRRAISYPNYVDNNEAERYLNEMANYYGVDLNNPISSGDNTYTWQDAIEKGVIPDYDVPFGLPGTGNIGTGTNRAELLQLTDAALNGFIDMSGKPEYNGQWEEIKNQLAEEALNMRYEDWLEGDQYRALQDRYGRKGKMAMEDVLGQIASRTGGLASSYAVSAANQQYNDFMAQLEEAAMDMFANERNNAIENANLAYSYADNDYNRYLDELGQYNTDRSFAYNAYMDALAQQNYLKELENEKANIEYDRGQSSRSEAQDRISSYLAAGGKVANLDRNLIELSGLTENELYAQEAYYTGKNKSSSGSSGRSGTSRSGYMDYEGLFEDAKTSRHPQSFIENRYKDYGFDKSGGLYNDYKTWNEQQEKAEKDAQRNGKNNYTEYYENYDRIPAHVGEDEMRSIVEKYPERFDIIEVYDDRTGKTTYKYKYKG